ncbi:MAG: hypothetical protein ACYDGO_00630 [Smithellaceae bacterium]
MAMLVKTEIFRKLIAVNADQYLQQKLVVADEKCLPVSSFIIEHGQGNSFPYSQRYRNAVGRKKLHGIFFALMRPGYKVVGKDNGK